MIKSGIFDEAELIEIISILTDKANVNGKFITKETLPFESDYDKKRKAYIYKINDEIDIKLLVNVHGFFLGTIEFNKGILKTKATLPKISKRDDNFAKLQLNNDEEVINAIKKVFCLDEIKTGKLEHTIYIDSIEMPKNIDVNDENIREQVKRKGKIVRIYLNKKEEIPFEV